MVSCCRLSAAFSRALVRSRRVTAFRIGVAVSLSEFPVGSKKSPLLRRCCIGIDIFALSSTY